MNPSVTVTGQGRVKIAADQVAVDLAIEIVRSEASQAFEAAAGSATTVLALLADGGVDSRSVRTTNMHLAPKLSWQDGQERMLGFSCGQGLLAVLQGLSGLSRLLSSVATAGVEGVRFNGLVFSAADPAQAQQQARALAIADAKNKAEHYAQLVGRQLGQAISVSEIPGSAGGGPITMMRAASLADMPVAPGEGEVDAKVEVVYEID
ncbi:DUF541 domain-containing protein [Nakamurella antarctica]|uniref:DUF541 domain-containing protein n=1 Tax=Nakamurella antarctica TaxID=1902245 RepID=A0A3G8ZPV4_9ACTN|nr:SIMPL domain-containing protein [Nakamurella antarctica]AZI59178.1 DUF541 domain-containing protein [Nakamurella antarctica]